MVRRGASQGFRVKVLVCLRELDDYRTSSAFHVGEAPLGVVVA